MTIRYFGNLLYNFRSNLLLGGHARHPDTPGNRIDVQQRLSRDRIPVQVAAPRKHVATGNQSPLGTAVAHIQLQAGTRRIQGAGLSEISPP